MIEHEIISILINIKRKSFKKYKIYKNNKPKILQLRIRWNNL